MLGAVDIYVSGYKGVRDHGMLITMLLSRRERITGELAKSGSDVRQ